MVFDARTTVMSHAHQASTTHSPQRRLGLSPGGELLSVLINFINSGTRYIQRLYDALAC